MMWIIIVVALIVVGAVVAFAMKGKNKPATPPAAKPQAQIKQPQARPVSRPEPAPAPVAKTEEKPAPAAAPTPVAQAPVAKAAPEPEKDPLDEAQAFISMERFPQAVGVLSKAIDKEPKRAVLYVLLLSIYQQQNDRESFDALYARLQPLNDADAMQQADQLKSLFAPIAPEQPADTGEPLAFTSGLAPKTEAPEDKPTEYTPAADDHPLEFTLEKPISDGQSPVLDLDQSDERAFLLDTPSPSSTTDELDALEAEFKTSGVRPALDLSALDNAVEPVKATDNAPLTDLSFDLAPTPDAAPAKTADDQVVDLDFNLDDSFALADDQHAVKTQEPANLAAGFDDQDFSLPADDQIKPVADSSAFTLEDLETPSASIDSQVDQFDAMLDQPSASTEGGLVNQLNQEFAFLNDRDEQQVNLDLAKSYADLGEIASAQELLEEVIAHGSAAQQQDAKQLQARLAS